MSADFSWIDFYSKFAEKLQQYKNNRTELIRKIQKVYQTIGLKLPTLDRTKEPGDIDSFTVYGLFNKGITVRNRIKIVEGFASEFGIQSRIPTEFPGVPVLNNLQATFYVFKDGIKTKDIYNLWDMFDIMLEYADSGSERAREAFCSQYDIVIQQNNAKWNITMAAYWIRPYFYIGLDSVNREFLKNPDYLSTDVAHFMKGLRGKLPTGKQYLELCEMCKNTLSGNQYEYTSIPELSYKAWSLAETSKQKDKNTYGEDAKKSSDALGDADVDTVQY